MLKIEHLKKNYKDFSLDCSLELHPGCITGLIGQNGAGKSYLVNAIVDNFGFKENQVAYACYTGKAALVLQKQGKNAIT